MTTVPSVRRLALVTLILWSLDVITKSIVVATLDNGRTIHVIWTLRLSLGYNSGFAFSLGQGFGPIIGIVALGAIVMLARSAIRASNAFVAYGLTSVVAGAIGNVTDRVFRGDGWMHGHVIDFIDFQWFPSFNFADSCITIGAGLLVVGMMRESTSNTDEVTS